MAKKIKCEFIGWSDKNNRALVKIGKDLMMSGRLGFDISQMGCDLVKELVRNWAEAQGFEFIG